MKKTKSVQNEIQSDDVPQTPASPAAQTPTKKKSSTTPSTLPALPAETVVDGAPLLELLQSLEEKWTATKVRNVPGPGTPMECFVTVIREVVLPHGGKHMLALWVSVQCGPLNGREMVIQIDMSEQGLFFSKAALLRLGIESLADIGSKTRVGMTARAVIYNPTGSRYQVEILEMVPGENRISVPATAA